MADPASGRSRERVQTDPRISRRRQAVERGKRKRLLVGAASLVLAVGIVWAMFWSPLMRVRDLKLLDAGRTTAQEIA